MKCRHNIIDYAHGQVSDRERRKIEQHLTTCAECRQQLSETKALLDDLKSIRFPEPGPEYWEGYRHRLARRLKEAGNQTGQPTGPFPRTSSAPVRLAWVSAAAIVLLAAGVIIGRVSAPDIQKMAERPKPQEPAPTVLARQADTVTATDAVPDWVDEPSVDLTYLSASALADLTDEEVVELADVLGIDVYGNGEGSENGLARRYLFGYSIYSELEDLSPQELEEVDNWFGVI